MNRWLLLSLLSINLEVFSAAVTYRFSGGRFGDNLVSYAHAMWVAYKRNIPLLYRRFKHSDQLEMSRIYDHYDQVKSERYSKILPLPLRRGMSYNILDFNADESTVFTVPYFPPNRTIKPGFYVDWQDAGFIAELRRGISLIHKRPLLELPNDRLCVGVHLRTGEGFDPIMQLRRRPADMTFPLKFPPNSFFVDQIKKMSELLNDQPIYVHVFTDSKRPEYFVDIFEREVNKPNIIYGYRTNTTPLDDFFAITQFKYFIRGDSNFSFMAGVLAQFEICIVPKKFMWETDMKLVITESEVLRSKA